MAEKDKPRLTSAVELFGPSIKLLQKYLSIYAVLLILPLVLVSISPGDGTGWDILIFSGFVLSVAFMAPLLYAEVRTASGHDVTLNEAFDKGLPYFWRLIGLIVLATLIIVGGLILFIIPGIIFARRYALAAYYMIDRNLGIMDSLRQSAAESKPFSWSIYGLFGVSILISMIGFFGDIGVAISTVISVLYSLAWPIRYFEIKKAYKQL